jgi:hypothetical protein
LFKISQKEPSQHGNITHFGFGLALSKICQTCGQWPATVPRGHDQSKISHTEPSWHGNITHWTHMKEMKWPSSGFLGVLAVNNLGFGLALAEICQTFAFGQQQCQEDIMSCP